MRTINCLGCNKKKLHFHYRHLYNHHKMFDDIPSAGQDIGVTTTRMLVDRPWCQKDHLKYRHHDHHDHPYYQMYHQQVVFDDRWKTLMSKRSRLTKTSSMTLIMVCLFGDHHPHHPPHHHHHIIIIIKCIITIHYQAFTSLFFDQFADNLWSNVNMNQPRKCLPLAPWMYVYTPLASPLSSPL